jgi:putative transposase
VTRVRDGSCTPSLIEPSERAERALVAVVQAAYLQAVSTRRVGDLVQALGLTGIGFSRAGRLCERLDGEGEHFRNRRPEGVYPLSGWMRPS